MQRNWAVPLAGLLLIVACTDEPSEYKVSHRYSHIEKEWLRSDYTVVGRDVKEYDDHSGSYVVLTIKHGKKTITAKCSGSCDIPMGGVQLERTDWDQLYYWSGSGEPIIQNILYVTKIELLKK